MSLKTDHYVRQLLARGEYALRNPREVDDLCDSLDLMKIDYSVSRGRGGFHVRLGEDALRGERHPAAACEKN